MSNPLPKATGLIAGALATLMLGACGLSPEAQQVADACAKIPHTTAESCQCYAKELQSKLKPELMRLAAYAQTDPAKLLDPAVIGNVSANDVIAVTQTSAAALQTCKIV
ncbi:MAG: hypothetical protein J0I99_14975 [Devosia sp.]|uniref:hypothetical protein n=1 Tax=Devosia sp. TaxID=1871048 RepID=UPI001AD3F07A|nr:hypothetical protein [Devosia sp.]MBN9317043.1 hypothetical protein [Devosia sp.]